MEFTHFNKQGRAYMVDVSEKNKTERIAIAYGRILMNKEVIEAIRDGKVEKGDVLSVAQVAGIMAAKHTPDNIPMCHPIIITGANVEFEINDSYIEIRATVKCKGETGVEMEALNAVSIAALTIYDMCKALQRDMVISDICLLYKSGGKSGVFERSDF